MDIVIIEDALKKKEIMRNLESVFLLRDREKHNEFIYDKVCKYAIFLVAKEDDNICGYCAFYANNQITHEAYITLIAVSNYYSGKGVGKNLINRAMDISVANGMKTCKLEVDKENTSAISLYVKLGFTKCEEREYSFVMSRSIKADLL